MKIAAALALAELAELEVPDEVTKAYHGRRLSFGKNYLIPTPFDPRLITTVPLAVAEAALNTGVARIKRNNLGDYQKSLAERSLSITRYK